MTLIDYLVARRLVEKDAPFYALVMACMMRADSTNIAKLAMMWPDVYDEVDARYNAPGGIVDADADSPGLRERAQAVADSILA